VDDPLAEKFLAEEPVGPEELQAAIRRATLGLKFQPVFMGTDEAAKAETRAMTAWALDVCLKLLHPVMPFVTEELWGKLAEFGAARDGMLITAKWPVFPEAWLDTDAEAEIDWVIALVSEVRSIRSEMNVPPSARAPAPQPGAQPRPPG
jgi:valyl-tRNA synthetase